MHTSSSSAPPHPYQSLTPDVVLDALESVGLVCDGRLMALSSYENRVYLAHIEPSADCPFEAVVAKFYRPQRWTTAQIVEEHDFAAELAQAEIPLVAPLRLGGATLHQHAGFDFSVSPKRGGRAPELDDFEVLEWTGRFLARIHNIGAQHAFSQRPTLDLQSFGQDSRDWLLAHDMIPLDVQSRWRVACDNAIQFIANNRLSTWTFAPFDAQNGFDDASDSPGYPGEATQAHVPDRPIAAIRLHGDCHPGNILWTPTDFSAGAGGKLAHGGPHFVDLDDARMGPAVQDLWMLASGDRQQRSGQLSALIDGYEQLRPFDRRELALIEPLRTLRLIHYSAWLARRWQDPSFPQNFPWFGSSDYWQGQVQMLEEQLEAMQEPPLMV